MDPFVVRDVETGADREDQQEQDDAQDDPTHSNCWIIRDSVPV
jgi:hypothetical protein